jgi:hypothetical protein
MRHNVANYCAKTKGTCQRNPIWLGSAHRRISLEGIHAFCIRLRPFNRRSGLRFEIDLPNRLQPRPARGHVAIIRPLRLWRRGALTLSIILDLLRQIVEVEKQQI